MIKKALGIPLLLVANPAFAFHYHCNIDKLNGHRPEPKMAFSIEKRSNTCIRFILYNHEGILSVKPLCWNNRYQQENDKELYLDNSEDKSLDYYKFYLNKQNKVASFEYNQAVLEMSACKKVSADHDHLLD